MAAVRGLRRCGVAYMISHVSPLIGLPSAVRSSRHHERWQGKLHSSAAHAFIDKLDGHLILGVDNSAR